VGVIRWRSRWCEGLHGGARVRVEVLCLRLKDLGGQRSANGRDMTLKAATENQEFCMAGSSK
jgi:hypothetical protein